MEKLKLPELQQKSRSVPLIMITGGIGSGKSVVSRILRLNGYNVYDCDSEAKRIMENDLAVIEALIEILGEEAYIIEKYTSADKRLNKNFVASKIFSDSQLRDMVNAVVHKAVREDVTRFADRCNGVAFCETAIPSTSHMTEMCDSVWLVTAPEGERIERVKIRNGFSDAEIMQRIHSQREEFDRIESKKIVNLKNGSNDMLLPQIFRHIPSTLFEEIIF